MKKIVFAIGAHPDDIEIGCGGTLCHLIDTEKYDVIPIIATLGEEGSHLIQPKKLASLRKAEAISSANVIGAKKVYYLNLPDGLTNYTKKDKIKLVKLIRKFRPEILFTHAQNDNLSDHRIVYELAVSAAQVAAGPWYSKAGKSPHQIQSIYGYEVWSPIQRPQLTVDITKFMTKKIKALKCHKTQIQNASYIQAVKGLAAYRGAMMMKGQYAEAFEIIRTGAIL